MRIFVVELRFCGLNLCHLCFGEKNENDCTFVNGDVDVDVDISRHLMTVTFITWNAHEN